MDRACALNRICARGEFYTSMQVTIERVSTFDLRNLLGFDVSQSVLDNHRDCIRRSTAIWLGLVDGVEACAVGVIPTTIFSTNAYLWMITTRICEQHPLLFVRWSRKVIAEVLALYPELVGLCSCDNISGRRWLEWLGAKFDSRPVNNEHYGFKFDGGDNLVLYRMTDRG